MTRLAIVDKDKCKNKVDCPLVCASVCPINRSGKECVVEGADGKPLINEDLCIGCGICPKKCQFEAIKIINLPEELEAQPIHRYGENQFELFSLPTPIFGKVVGVLGQNGIGKSTAIKILAGVLKPNLGEIGKKTSYNDLIKFFKGTEAQSFFEKVKSGEIKISYKPQAVDLIPKAMKGKVKTLLKKVDEKKEFDKVVKELGLEKFLDTDIKKISGGELQRVAIAATVLKKANFYVFDEPASYLDIKQRIKVSKFIKSLADKDTAVMVIEHDLIILDYLTDLVHLMYGKEGCYGVVSQPKSTKVGINVYLSGYLKEENMLFRDSTIKFEIRPAMKMKSRMHLTAWEGITNKLGKFNLIASKGELFRNEVVGVLGENGIGKTSFVKILAGVEKQAKGKMTDKVKVSYKPQYIDTVSKELVMNVLSKALKKYNNQIIKPLEIKPLLMKKLNELSGGELQKVAIALCLSEDADLYLLDEPSAYLDVEQRLRVSKIIKDIMEERCTTALVVDHDLLFIDYLSHRLLVFDGIPAEKGEAKGPFEMEEGMNLFLEDLGMTFRRDEESNMPRANKEGSVKDREQKSKGKYYYL